MAALSSVFCNVYQHCTFMARMTGQRVQPILAGGLAWICLFEFVPELEMQSVYSETENEEGPSPEKKIKTKNGTPSKKTKVVNQEKEHSKDEKVEQISRKKKKTNYGTPDKKKEGRAAQKNDQSNKEEASCKDKKKTKNVAAEETDEEVERYPIIFNRCSPKQLIRALKKLSRKQKDKLREVGFEGILNLQVDGIPQRLGYFVAHNFDETRMEIKAPCGNIKVDASSLSKLLGFANSGCSLLHVEPNKPLNPRILKWRLNYKNEYIAPIEIVKNIICNGEDDSFDFVLNFLVLFITTMVECHSHGKCKLDILELLTHDTNLKNINWCTYILSRIKVCKSGWAGTSTSAFRGALTILTLLYVDSVTLASMNVDHQIPAITFWDFERLKERENIEIHSGSFGKGKYVGMSAVGCNVKKKSVVVAGQKSMENLSMEVHS
ncbi:hypothetical protein E3N88_07447 [Mikania micrantha]|uniref:Uncharacterized protein n=1 Tax=Mikania micrantha TaxID=192012 RepID=A0A5N6PS94_9ASTR|nr:hypothetical protein E3N88_07447 [Mikania micrantha]